jgi:hypothetical protein
MLIMYMLKSPQLFGTVITYVGSIESTDCVGIGRE